MYTSLFKKATFHLIITQRFAQHTEVQSSKDLSLPLAQKLDYESEKVTRATCIKEGHYLTLGTLLG